RRRRRERPQAFPEQEHRRDGWRDRQRLRGLGMNDRDFYPDQIPCGHFGCVAFARVGELTCAAHDRVTMAQARERDEMRMAVRRSSIRTLARELAETVPLDDEKAATLSLELAVYLKRLKA